MKLASTSRNIQLLENRIGERGSEPVALVEVKAHPRDYRRKVVSLTPMGRDLYKRLCSLVSE
jgi:DNA-binding MarR family transcriptional regulator